jgi:hypothetical protein
MATALSIWDWLSPATGLGPVGEDAAADICTDGVELCVGLLGAGVVRLWSRDPTLPAAARSAPSASTRDEADTASGLVCENATAHETPPIVASAMPATIAAAYGLILRFLARWP